MKNESVKIKIEIDFTYDNTALKIIEEEIKKHKKETNEDITVEEFLNKAVEAMIYERFTCDYECVDGETMETNWTIEKS